MKVDKKTVNGLSIGMLAPALQYNFSLEFKISDLSDAEACALTSATVSISIDILNKTAEVVIQQPVVSALVEAVDSLISNASRFVSNHLELNLDINSGCSISLHGIQCISHNIEFRYANNNQIANHKLTFSYKTIQSNTK